MHLQKDIYTHNINHHMIWVFNYTINLCVVKLMLNYLHINHEITVNTRRRFNFCETSTLRYRCRIDV